MRVEDRSRETGKSVRDVSVEAGIENELFYDPKAMMLFGDAKDTVTKLIQAVKTL